MICYICKENLAPYTVCLKCVRGVVPSAPPIQAGDTVRLEVDNDDTITVYVNGEKRVPSAPSLPDTFVERAIRAAHAMLTPNSDTEVMLSAFEASAIRRGLSSAAAPLETK